MFSVLVWGCNWILFIQWRFCPIRLIHLIGRKSLHFEKKLDWNVKKINDDTTCRCFWFNNFDGLQVDLKHVKRDVVWRVSENRLEFFNNLSKNKHSLGNVNRWKYYASNLNAVRLRVWLFVATGEFAVFSKNWPDNKVEPTSPYLGLEPPCGKTWIHH